MRRESTSVRRRSTVATMVMAMILAMIAAPTGAAAHPGGFLPGDDHHEPVGIGVQVTSPEGLAGFFSAVQWSDSGEVDDQTAELAYAGTGCTPASYLAADVAGKIALVDSRVSQNAIPDDCPASTFFQKARGAQEAGAIGFVQIPAEGDEPRANATAVAVDIPALEVERTDAILAVRDAVVDGTAVTATLVNTDEPIPAMSDVKCEDGFAGPFACDGIDLLALMPQEEFNGAGVSDLWGWTDPDTGDEYVIMGKTNGVAFFRITEPTAPVYLGELPNPGLRQEVWHDIKVFDNHAFIVSESEPHGMEVFDLTRLRDVQEPQEWGLDAHYRMHSAAHNLEINTDTGFAYIVGGNAGLVVPDQCMSGLHMVDISEPQSPRFAGCYLEEGGPGTAARSVGAPATDVSPAAYVHDTQCVVYDGPDDEHDGREICFNSAEDKVVIVDVTDKLAPVTLGVTDYPNVGYTHQGWLTDDHGYLIVNDELDEMNHGIETRTVVLDVTDLDAPTLHFEHTHGGRAITHNNYVHDGFVYQSNYAAGLRVLDVADVPAGSMEEVAFFDTYPTHDDTTFDGTWSNYPFFESGTIAVSGRAEGLFLLRLAGDDEIVVPDEPGVEMSCADCSLEIRAGESATATPTVHNTGNVDDSYDVTAEGVPEGWTVTVDPATVGIGAGEAADVAVTVDVPKRARAGDYAFTLTTASTEHTDVSASQVVEVEVRKGPPSHAGGPEERGQAQASTQSGHGSGDTAEQGQVVRASVNSSHDSTVNGLAVLAVAVMSLFGLSAVRRRLTGRVQDT